MVYSRLPRNANAREKEIRTDGEGKFLQEDKFSEGWLVAGAPCGHSHGLHHRPPVVEIGEN